MSFFEESEKLTIMIENGIDNGFINSSMASKIGRVQSTQSIIKYFKEVFSIDDSFSKDFWWVVINTIWDVNEKNGLFESAESAFIKILLSEGGVIKHSEVCQSRSIHTDGKTRTVADSLIENGLIVREKFYREVIYILDLEFFQKVKNYGKD